jgi:hypothetical protein
MGSPWETTEQDPAVARLVRRRAPDPGPQPSLLRRPENLVVVAGAALAIAASPLPWLVRVGNPPPQTVSGWSGVADGFFLSVTSAALVALVLNREAAASRSPIFRWLPLLLAAVAATFGVGAVRSMANQVHIWQGEGASGAYQPPFYVALLGAAILSAGSAWIGIRRVRVPARPSESLRPSRATVAWALLGGLGEIGGAGGVAILILNSGLDPVAMSLPLMVGVMVGGIVGGNAGARIARTASTKAAPTATPGLDRVVPGVVRTRGAPDELHDRDLP